MQTRAQHELLLRMENAVEERVLAALKRTLKPVADTITAAGSNVHALRPRPQVSMDNLSRIHAAWVQEVREELLPLYLEVYAAGAGAAALGLTGTFEIPSVVNVLSEAWLAQASNRLVRIGDVAWEETRTSLLEGFAEGESIPKLASRVRNVIDDTESRARTIARTEVISASNAGSLAGAAQYGAVQKVWLATADSRTRETHLDADGQSVGMDELFSVGDDSLRFPGDPNGSPDEIINCRCTLIYQTDEGTGDAAVCVPGFVDGTDDPTCAGEDTPSEDLAASGGWDHVHDG
jgi:SPP1 gp7 family putative phage head morphogenesis protein